jgi:hypothetical protein
MYIRTEDEFMNIHFRWGFWPSSCEFWDLRIPNAMFTLQTSFNPLLLKGGGGSKTRQLRWLWIARRKTLETFVPITSKNSVSLPYSVILAFFSRNFQANAYFAQNFDYIFNKFPVKKKTLSPLFKGSVGKPPPPPCLENLSRWFPSW